MSGTVGVIADTWSRATNFWQCLTTLSVPAGTVIDFRIGADRGRSRNELVTASLDRGSEWMMFIDDDHSFPGTLLETLLSREQPVVSSLYLQRTDPFFPIAYVGKTDEGHYEILDLASVPEHGLVPIRGAGTGGMLVHSEVFRHLEPPWFLHTTQQSEDLYFCDRCHEAEIPMYLDLDARLGHIAPLSIYPAWEEGRWVGAIGVSPSLQLYLDIQDFQRGEADA